MRESFVEALECEMVLRRDFFEDTGSSIATLYIGGGTPSVLSAGQLERIVRSVSEIFGLPHLNGRENNGRENNSRERMPGLEEFTVEVNPNDITPEYAAFLVTIGVNRVSMGIQSFIDSHLRWMNRRHTCQEGIQAYRILREAGIENISLDLIFGYSLLSERDWEYNIDKITELAPEHISAYQMSIEPGSVLGAMYRKGIYEPLSDEECLKQYRLLQKRLADAGYLQYEISNFARPGFHSKHNSSYWSGEPYIGFGPSAHSYTGISGARRLWNTPSVKKYCAHYLNGAFTDILDYETLTAENIFNETIMLGLRKVCGFSLDSLAVSNAEFLHRITPDINRLVKRGLLVKEGGNIRIPAEKLFISDAIIRELFL